MTNRNRRKFLQLASSLLAAPLLPLTQSRAQTPGKPPLRFLTVIDSYGIPTAGRESLWVDSTVGDYALASQNLGTILSPLSAYLDNMLVVSGINLESRKQTNDAPTHNNYTLHTLTGSQGNGKGAGATQHHASLDVHIGEYLSGAYGLTSPRVYPHLFLSDYQTAGAAGFCFNEQGKQIRAVSGVQNIVNALFGAGGDQNAVLLDTQAQLVAAGLLGDRLQSIRGELINANASTVMDAYSSSVEDLATELELRVNLECVTPDVSGAPTGKNGRATRYVFESIGHAFACDLVSSLTYTIGGEQINQHKYSFLYDAEVHNDANLLSQLKKNLHASSHSKTVIANKVHELVRIYQAEHVAKLLDTLSVTPDIDGRSVLDNTVVFMTSAMSNNSHSGNNYGYLLLAGANTGLRGGFHYDCSGSTNCDLLTTIANGLTLPDTDFGGYRKSGARLGPLNLGPITKMLKN